MATSESAALPSTFETILYREEGAVAWVTLNRPEVYNAFNNAMMREVASVWRHLRTRDDIRAAVLTASGDRAFCTGIDRGEAMANADVDDPDFLKANRGTSNPYMFDDPGMALGPKASDLWKPVICAVNGMACGGAFYMLGEVDVIVAADSATFFDPHVTYGMAAVFEPISMLQRMPLGEVLRLSLMGNYEHMSAETAHRVGLVSEVCAGEELEERARFIANAIASQPSDAVQTTLRAIWYANDVGRSRAMEMGPAFLGIGNTPQAMAEGQEFFDSGERIRPHIR